jgi:hypothetical protein
MERIYFNKKTWKTLVFGFSLLSCLLVINVVVYGQVKFYTRVDQEVVAKNQPIQLQYVVENAKSVDEFKAPAFTDFILIQGPIESTGMSIVNGNTTQYKSLVYLLQPKSTGKINIKGATAVVDGKEMRSNNIIIEVTNKSVFAPTRPTQGFNFSFPGDRPEIEREFYLRPGENIIEKIKQNLFVKVEVNKTSCFVNEPIVATYKLYSRLRSESRVVKRPSYNGFSVYDMIEPDGSVTTTETLNGKEYNVHLIRQSQLFPLQAGTYTLDPVEVENSVRFIKSAGDEGNPFDEIFDQGGQIVEQTLNLSSKPVAITVKSLPVEKQPSSFDGAVGNFNINAYLSKDTIHQGEMANLIVSIKGKGNLPIINAPDIQWPKGMEGFDPKTSEDLHPETVPLNGEKTFRFPITAKKTGSLLIPAVHFSFFDPTSKSYKIDSTPEVQLYVLNALPGQKATPSTVVQSPASSIHFSEKLLLSLVGIVVFLMALTWAIFHYRAEKRKREARKALLIQQEQLLKLKPDPLDKARQLLASGDQLAFLKEMENVIWRKTAEKLSIPLALLNQPTVMSELKARGDSDTATLFRELVNNCEASLYIPGNQSENLQDILDKSSILFSRLDSIEGK